MLLLLLLVALLHCTAGLAFPGAYGFGANATGGRGGAVYHVITLDDAGAGSFRDAVSKPNRVIVFDVGGYIVLKGPVALSSDLTIAGQSAPGAGIGIMAGEVSISKQSNVIIRGLRIRQGRQDPATGKSAINMGDASKVILDHCSFAYGQWDSVDAVGTVNFTVQNCIIADPIGQQFGAHVESPASTFFRNLWVNAHNRQPLAKSNNQFINNVLYNFEAGYTCGNTGGLFKHDIISNYFIAGPSTTNTGDAFFQVNNKQSAYGAGNMMDSKKDGNLSGVPYNTIGSALVLPSPWSPSTVTMPTLSAPEAYATLVAYAGATPRDEVDESVLRDVLSLGKSGKIYKDQNATGLGNDGYGTIAGGAQFTDSAGDGIADYWAVVNGISIADPGAGSLPYRSSGYTNIEVYVNSLILPSPWTWGDAATGGVRGASSYNPITDTWILTGSALQFASQPWPAINAANATTLSARVRSLGAASELAQGGVLVICADGSAFVTVAANTTGIVMRWQSAGGAQQEVAATGVVVPVWLRIEGGEGGPYAGAYSTDGALWTQLASASVTWPTGAAGALRAGLAYTSGDSESLSVGAFSSVAPNGS